jgi:hypothetical protein
MKPANHPSARRSKLCHQKHVSDRAVLIRDMADALGITAIEIELSNLLKNTFRVQFGDCTGRMQTLFISAAATPARVNQTLRFVSGPRLKAS